MSGPSFIGCLLNGNTPTEDPPIDPPWAELARLLLDAQQSDRHAVLNGWIEHQDTSVATEVMSGLVQFHNQESNAGSNIQLPQTRIWSLDQFITEDFGQLPVLVGEENNALLAAGDGMFIVGTSGAGKTNLCMDFALRMAAGLDVIGYRTPSPLNVLILQAELTASYLQYRFNRMVRGYESANGSDFRESLSRVHIVDLLQPLDLCCQENLQLLSGWVEEYGARVVILDPFLSFFRGEENSNSEVRKFLDSLRYQVASPYGCGVIITDHVAKDFGKELSARGAGAKGDWAASIINISTGRDPSNPDVRIVSAKISKTRHGLDPGTPILLRRDPQTLTHSLIESERDVCIEQIRQLVVDEGGEIQTQTALIQLIRENLNVGARVARGLIAHAVDNGVLETETGRSNSRVYRIASSTEDRTDSTRTDGDDE